MPTITRSEFVRQRDGDAAVEPYRALMRRAYRGAVLKCCRGKKSHPFRRLWIEGYLEFKRWRCHGILTASTRVAFLAAALANNELKLGSRGV